MPDDRIRATLAAQGWTEADVRDAWTAATAQLQVNTLPVPKKPRHRVTAADMLLFVGGLIIIVAVFLLILPGWGEWAPWAHIVATVLPTIILVAAGLALWPKEEHRHAAHMFLVTGGLVFPLALGITLRELAPAGFEDRHLLLTAAVITTVVYGLAYRRFRRVVWILLAVLASLIGYQALLQVIGVDRWDLADPWSWGYVLYGLLAFGLGLLVERSAQRYASRPFYFFGVAALIIALSVLGLTGHLFGSGGESAAVDRAVFSGTTTFVVGCLFLAFGWLTRVFRARGLGEAGAYVGIWDFVGVLGASGAWTIASGGNKSLGFALLAIVVSLGFVALAVRVQSRQYFQAASLIIAATLVKMGTDNFSRAAGWPVALMAVGLLFMAGGYGLTKFQRRFLPSQQAATPAASAEPPARPTSGA